MNASAAVQGLFRIPRAGPAFRRSQAGEDAAPPCGWDARVETIGNILRHEGYTVTQLSAATRRRYGSKSPYFIPASFLYHLRSGVTPHVCQIVALSESTGYRFVDWLRMCGFDLRQIFHFQIRLHSQRTVLVTPMGDCFEPLMPRPILGYERHWSSAFCSRRGEWGGRGRYLHAKIGISDALHCPKLVPGNIVRVDRYYAERVRHLDHVSVDHLLWLVEQPSGLTCCGLRWIDDRQIVLLPNRPPWGRWPLHLPTEARILGLVDADMDIRRPQQVRAQPRTAPMSLEQFSPPHIREERIRFSDLLRISRRRSGLTFRAAHRLTRAITQILGNREYAIALGMLSDYEALGKLPRHITKILSLCAVYCMDVRDLMEAAGVNIDDSAKLPLPMLAGRLEIRSEFLENAAHPGTSGVVASYARSAGAQS
jgi:hypothetical protein